MDHRNSISDYSLNTTMARQMGLFRSSLAMVASAYFLPSMSQAIFHFFVSISMVTVSPSLILDPPFLLSAWSQMKPVFSQQPMNSLLSWARLRPLTASVPTPYMKEPLLPALTCLMWYLVTSFRSMGCLDMRMSHVPPQFLRYLLPISLNFLLCGLVQSVVNLRGGATGMADCSSFSFFHFQKSLRALNILVIAQSFLLSSFWHFSTSSLISPASASCLPILSLRRLFSTFSPSISFSSLQNLSARTACGSNSCLTVLMTHS